MRTAIAVSILLAAMPAAAAEQPVQLKQGQGREVVENNCQACHSLDYIIMNSPIQDQKAWDATLTKMIDVMGAPVTPEDRKIVLTYLVANYGKATAAAPTPVMGR